jgi:DNA-binding CsgD family transcriptional regulator
VRRSGRAVREEVRRVCRAEQDPISVQRAVAAVLPEAVPFDRWCALVLDPATMLATTGYHAEGLPPQTLPRLLEIEAADDNVNAMPWLARTGAGVSTIDRATGGKPETSTRYRDVLAPGGLGREMRAVLRERSAGWGGMIFFRETAAPDFSDEEMAFVADIAEDVARGIRRGLLRSELAHRDGPDVPGVLVVAAGGLDVEVVSAAARRWLERVADPSPGDELPFPVVSVVTRARGSRDRLARTRLRARDGHWLTLYAEALGPGPDAQVSVVLEPTRPYELAAIMADAYLLTQREREVARHVLLGRSTAEIAAALFLSPWTVQDHLKKVFDKVGVRSRAELASRLYLAQYEPRAAAGTPLGGDGWFIDGPATGSPAR